MWVSLQNIFVSAARRRNIKMPLRHNGVHVEKFNTVSNDHGRMQKDDFSVLDRIYPFWVNLVQKLKILEAKI